MNHPNTPSRPGAPRGGFTMVEMVIALLILTVGILAVAGLMASSIWHTRKADDITNSTIVALQVLDSLAMLDFDDVDVGEYADTITFGPAVYHVQWTVEAVSDSSVAGGNELKKITALSGGGLTQTNAEPWELYIYKLGGAS